KQTKANVLNPRLRVLSRKHWIRLLTPPLGAHTLELFGCQRNSFLPQKGRGKPPAVSIRCKLIITPHSPMSSLYCGRNNFHLCAHPLGEKLPCFPSVAGLPQYSWLPFYSRRFPRSRHLLDNPLLQRL